MRNLFKTRSINFILLFLFIGCFIFQVGCSSDSASEPQPDKGPKVELSPEEDLYFGQIPDGQKAIREFLIHNTGDKPLVISEMIIEGSDAASFTFEGVSGEITVPINKIQSFPVRFDPAEVKSFEAQVTITSDANTSPDVQLLTGTAISSAGNITFERIIGQYGSDNGGAVRVLSDGGFIIAGSSHNREEDENQATLFRLDQYGNLLWNKQYPVAGIASFSGLVVTASGNYVCTGWTKTASLSQEDVFALSTDDNGDILWQEVYELGGTQKDTGNDIIKTTHGGFIICGTTYNTDEATGGVTDALLLKIDNNGTYEWHKVYGTTFGEEANSIKQTKDGGYIFTGKTTVPSDKQGGDFDFLLVKTDGDGKQLWLKTYGGSNYDFALSIVIDELGGYVMAGSSSSFGAGGYDYWVIKTDTSGVIEWDNTYGDTDTDDVSEIIQTSDNGFYIVGTSNSFTVGENGQPTNKMWIIKTDNNGNMDWDKIYGGERGDSGSSACELDGGYIISGSTLSFGIGSEVYVLRTNGDGSI